MNVHIWMDVDTFRHEIPVKMSGIEILHQDLELVVVDKPASLPVSLNVSRTESQRLSDVSFESRLNLVERLLTKHFIDWMDVTTQCSLSDQPHSHHCIPTC